MFSTTSRCWPRTWSPRLNHSLVGQYRGLTRPIKFERTPGPAPFAAPSFGEHTRAVLEEAGCSEAEIERLKTARWLVADRRLAVLLDVRLMLRQLLYGVVDV